jgi:Spy/CpxP family protein refolding chaperone
MKLLKTAVAVALLAAAGASLAQTGQGAHAGHGMHQPGDRIVKILNLDATRAAQVTAIMTEQRAQGKALWEANKGSTDREAKHAQMKALHEATKAKLATVLTAAELAQLKDTMMKHRHHGDGPKPS